MPDSKPTCFCDSLGETIRALAVLYIIVAFLAGAFFWIGEILWRPLVGRTVWLLILTAITEVVFIALLVAILFFGAVGLSILRDHLVESRKACH